MAGVVQRDSLARIAARVEAMGCRDAPLLGARTSSSAPRSKLALLFRAARSVRTRTSALPALAGFEIVSDHLEIFPRFAFFRRIAQQVSGVKSGHHFNAAEILKLSAHTSDTFAHFQ